jgi:hypothetical protein
MSRNPDIDRVSDADFKQVKRPQPLMPARSAGAAARL